MNDSRRTGRETTLLRPVERQRDHVRGGNLRDDVVVLVVYADYLCPYCRRLNLIITRLRAAMGERLAYVFRHFPNETAHPGASRIARASEAAARQGRFWELNDWIWNQEPPITERQIRDFVTDIGLDVAQFDRDVESDETYQRVEADLAEGRRSGVTGTPSFFIDGVRYDGAWDFHSMLEALQLPLAARVQRSARAFASLPASGGLVLLLAAAAALICANSPLAPAYHSFIEASFGIGLSGSLLSMTVAEWFSQGLLAIFFLLVGLEIRREMTVGDLSDARAAILPALAALGGVLAPAAIYLALNSGPAARGWSVPTATDIAFVLGILALLGPRVPPSLRVFVAALAVVDDLLSVTMLAIFYAKGFEADWLLASCLAVGLLFALNRWRVYSTWPYLVVTLSLWASLLGAGIHGALAGIFLAAFLPTRPAPAAAPLLAQAATALAALEHAENEARLSGMAKNSIAEEPIWEWASLNLSAASDRLLSPADRIERAVAPWSTYVILPLFAFSAAGVSFSLDLSAPGAWRILLGVVLGLVIGKPLGITVVSLLAVKSGIARGPDDVTLRNFVGAACLCGIGDAVSFLMAGQAFPDGPEAALAKTGVLIGSVLAAVLGATIIATNPSPVARSEMAES
jgi:Na+:H+ antiporter, NhaA family